MSTTSLELLQAMPIFGAISDDTLKFLLQRSSDVQVARDDYFFRENDQGSSMFVLEQGRVAVLKSWVDQTKDLAYLNEGDCFGEMALIEMGARSASIQATEDCTAIELSIDSLHELYQHDLEQFTIIQMNMSREVCRRLRKADDLLFQAQMQTSTLGRELPLHLRLVGQIRRRVEGSGAAPAAMGLNLPPRAR